MAKTVETRSRNPTEGADDYSNVKPGNILPGIGSKENYGMVAIGFK